MSGKWAALVCAAVVACSAAKYHSQPLNLDRLTPTLLDTAGKDVILLGESHGVAVNEEIDLALLRYLHGAAGVRTYISEGGYSANCLLNRYLDTGDEQLLDYMMQEMHGSVSWTKEHRDFFVKFRQWNLSLPAAERVHFIGLDVEHQVRVALRYLSELVAGRGTPGAAIAGMVQELKDRQPSAEFVAELQESIASHRTEYAAFLGGAIFDFALVAKNLQKAVDFYDPKNRARADKIRETAMYENFMEIYPRLRGAPCYGRWGTGHVLQRGFDRGETFAAMLNRAESPVKGKVLSIVLEYANSSAMWSNYSVHPVGDNFLVTKPLAASATGPLALFRLADARGLKVVKSGGVAADYAQYVILVRSGAASHPLR